MQLSLFQQYQPPEPRYGGHENQPVQRFWLQKAVKTVHANPRCFQGEDACLSWGLSRTRLQSLLFWALAFKVILPQGTPGCYVVSAWGESLLGLNGSDPYLEDLSSLWLLHWQLLQPPCYARAWGWFFTNPQHPSTEEELIRGLTEWSRDSTTIAESRLKSDLKCLLKMYCPSRQSLEDELLNLFGDVPLVKQDDTLYTRFTGPREGLTAAVSLYCCLDYASHQHSIKVSQCAYGAASPGIVFNLSYHYLVEALGYAANVQAGVTFSNSVDGGYQLSWCLPIKQLKQQIWQSIADGERWAQKEYF